MSSTGVLFDPQSGTLAGTANNEDIDAHPPITSAASGDADDDADAPRSLVNPNLHLEMSSLVDSLHSPSRRSLSFSFSRRSVKDLARAQAAGGAEGALHGASEMSNEAMDQQEELTEKAVSVIRRVMDKLNGLDFAEGNMPVDRLAVLDVHEQVDRLIRQAMANENLCLAYFGWCSFW